MIFVKSDSGILARCPVTRPRCQSGMQPRRHGDTEARSSSEADLPRRHEATKKCNSPKTRRRKDVRKPYDFTSSRFLTSPRPAANPVPPGERASVSPCLRGCIWFSCRGAFEREGVDLL